MKCSGHHRKARTLSILFGSGCLVFSTQPAFAGLIAIDGSVFIQIANFLFLIWVLNILLYKPIRKIVLERKEKIEGLEQGIETLTGDAQEKDQAFSAGIKDARVKGMAEKEKFLQAAADEEKAIIDKINKKAQANLAEIREQVATDTEKARAALLGQVDDFANNISEKILGRTV